MLHATSSSRRLARWLFKPLEWAIVGIVNTTLFFRFGNMHLEGLTAFIGAILALLAATTSLLFNRARAYPSGPIQRRSLLAAELCLRATFLAAIGASIAAIAYPFMISLGYLPTPMNKYPTQWPPALIAFLLGLFFFLSSLLLLKVGRLLSPTLFVFLRARQLRKAIKQHAG